MIAQKKLKLEVEQVEPATAGFSTTASPNSLPRSVASPMGVANSGTSLLRKSLNDPMIASTSAALQPEKPKGYNYRDVKHNPISTFCIII